VIVEQACEAVAGSPDSAARRLMWSPSQPYRLGFAWENGRMLPQWLP
jgi:hypothetical protein